MPAFNWDSIQQFVRIVLNWFAASLVTGGYLSQEMSTTLVGALMGLFSVGWWFFWDRNRTA